jgi:hypothetical protein
MLSPYLTVAICLLMYWPGGLTSPQKFKQMQEQGVSPNDPEYIKAHQLLATIQRQQLMKQKQRQQQAQQAQQQVAHPVNVNQNGAGPDAAATNGVHGKLSYELSYSGYVRTDDHRFLKPGPFRLHR